MVQESLLQGTGALPWGTVEVTEYRGKWLVRYKSVDRQVCTQFKFDLDRVDEAMARFWECADELKRGASLAGRV